MDTFIKLSFALIVAGTIYTVCTEVLGKLPL